MLAKVPLSPAAEVNGRGVAARAFVDWRRTPVGDRILPLFKLKSLLDDNRDDLALAITDECGKTLAESRPKCGAPLRTSRLPAACPR